MNPTPLTPEQIDLIQAGRLVVRTKHLFDLSKRHCAVIDALVMESLSQGQRSVVIPSNQTLHELCGVPPQHIPTVIEDLEACRVIQRAETPDGMKRYRVNPDAESWRVRPTVAVQTSRAARSIVAQINGRAADDLPPRLSVTIPAFAAHDSGEVPCSVPCRITEFPTTHLRRASA
jgi:hypothetical protein